MEPTGGSAQHASAADLEAQVFREQVRLAFELLPVAILANTALTVAVYLVLLRVVPAVELSVWFVLMLGLIGVRAGALLHYRRTPPEQRNDRRYATWYFVPYVITGLGWSVLAAVMVPPDEEVYAVLAMCAVYGLAAGGVALLGHLRDLYAAYLFVTLLPAAAKWLALWWDGGGDFRLVVGVTTLVFVALLYGAAHQLSRLVAGAVGARVEKENLARRLQELVATVERANQAKGEFIARMSEQVYAPARTIVEQADRLLAGAPQRATLQGLHDDAEALVGMLGDVRDFSALEAGRLVIAREDFDLREVLGRAAAAARSHARAKGLRFSFRVAREAPAWVQGDPRRLVQILANLLANAVRFCEAGMVSLEVKVVSVEGARHTLAFVVRDTGIGIAAHRLGEIFQPFNHAEGPAQAHGSGLGLAICRRLAGLMQGAIAVESEPRTGSVFTLMLAFNEAAQDGRPAVVNAN